MDVYTTYPKHGKPLEPHQPPPPPPPPRNARKHGRRNACLVVIASILGLSLILVILGLTVFKVKRPVTTIHSVTLQDMDFSLDMTRLQVHFNITLDVNLSITNQNKIGFKFSNSTAFLEYRGDVVAEVPIPAGKLSPSKTMFMTVAVTFLTDRLLYNLKLYMDVLSGMVPFTTTTRISGQANILKIFKIHVVSHNYCDISINLKNKFVTNQICHSKTKL